MTAMRIDAHQHFWTLARGDYGWLTPALGPIHRDFGPADLAPLLAEQRIDRTILVQAAPTEAETEFMLAVAARTTFVAGVVGWCEFEAPDAAERIARLSADPLLVGLRPMVHDIADPDWLARPDLAPAFAALIAHGLTFDALLRPQHLKPLCVLLARHPTLACVVDHAAKPNLVSGEISAWRQDISAVATHQQVFCKLSGLATEANEDWTIETLRPVFDHLLASFGPDRLIFGSDWPVLTLRAGYARWVGTVEELIADLPEADRAAIMGGNARRFYLSYRGRN
ncbi:amidohydrolase family protein [Bosea sp. BK604]|uniref:amidohydrolase family protein n=1 Tax=Bosea sp. BK604 TaxID=2512180 RepID=UPI0032B77AFB